MNGNIMKNSNTYARVSVVIPCYCCSGTIERAIDSVIKQTVIPVEIWLIDDASPDNGKTINLLFKLKKQYSHLTKIEVISLTKNSGPSTTRNEGWKRATQTYIAFLDADDTWHPRKIEIQYKWMESHNNVAITGHLYKVIDSRKVCHEKVNRFKVNSVSGMKLLLSNCFATSTVMLKKDIDYRFLDGKRYSEDYLLWVEILLNGHVAYVIEFPLAYQYKATYGQSGLSGNLWNMQKGELDTYRRIKKSERISLAKYLLFSTYSILKFILRVILVKFNKIKSLLAFSRS